MDAKAAVKSYKLKCACGGQPAGTVVYRLRCHDYGLANDDTRATGVEHISVTLNADGDYPSFTVPLRDLSLMQQEGA